MASLGLADLETGKDLRSPCSGLPHSPYELMKRLLAVMLLMGAPTLAGDLGPADLKTEDIPDQQLFKNRIYCGNPIGAQPECTVEFKGGLLVVDGKHAIRSHQVRHFSLSDIDSFAKKFEIVYVSNAGQITRAQVSIVYEREVNRFYKAFLSWLNDRQGPLVNSSTSG